MSGTIENATKAERWGLIDGVYRKIPEGYVPPQDPLPTSPKKHQDSITPKSPLKDKQKRLSWIPWKTDHTISKQDKNIEREKRKSKYFFKKKLLEEPLPPLDSKEIYNQPEKKEEDFYETIENSIRPGVKKFFSEEKQKDPKKTPSKIIASFEELHKPVDPTTMVMQKIRKNLFNEGSLEITDPPGSFSHDDTTQLTRTPSVKNLVQEFEEKITIVRSSSFRNSPPSSPSKVISSPFKEEPPLDIPATENVPPPNEQKPLDPKILLAQESNDNTSSCENYTFSIEEPTNQTPTKEEILQIPPVNEEKPVLERTSSAKKPVLARTITPRGPKQSKGKEPDQNLDRKLTPKERTGITQILETATLNSQVLEFNNQVLEQVARFSQKTVTELQKNKHLPLSQLGLGSLELSKIQEFLEEYFSADKIFTEIETVEDLLVKVADLIKGLSEKERKKSIALSRTNSVINRSRKESLEIRDKPLPLTETLPKKIIKEEVAKSIKNLNNAIESLYVPPSSDLFWWVADSSKTPKMKFTKGILALQFQIEGINQKITQLICNEKLIKVNEETLIDLYLERISLKEKQMNIAKELNLSSKEEVLKFKQELKELKKLKGQIDIAKESNISPEEEVLKFEQEIKELREELEGIKEKGITIRDTAIIIPKELIEFQEKQTKQKQELIELKKETERSRSNTPVLKRLFSRKFSKKNQ